MAVNIIDVDTTFTLKSWDVTWNLDSDTTAQITHGFGTTPKLVWYVPKTAESFVGAITVTWDATNITLTKNTAVGSGGASVRVFAMLPHSLIE